MVSHTIRQRERLGLNDTEASWVPASLYVQLLFFCYHWSFILHLQRKWCDGGAWIKSLPHICFSHPGTQNAEMLSWFFPAMVAYPEKQRKCQEELDAVVGRSRLPTFEDREHLPYLTATVREILRWRPAAPLGVFFYASVVNTAHLRHAFRCSARYQTGRKITAPYWKTVEWICLQGWLVWRLFYP